MKETLIKKLSVKKFPNDVRKCQKEAIAISLMWRNIHESKINFIFLVEHIY
jgi:hypothetical protein